MRELLLAPRFLSGHFSVLLQRSRVTASKTELSDAEQCAPANANDEIVSLR